MYTAYGFIGGLMCCAFERFELLDFIVYLYIYIHIYVVRMMNTLRLYLYSLWASNKVSW